MTIVLKTAILVCVIAASASACATKGFVRESVSAVNEKVESLSQSIEATQAQTKENAARIEQVDQKAGQAGSAAQTAQTSAMAARSAADAAAARVAAVETATRRLIFQVVISDDQGNFEPGKADLPGDVRAKLDELAAKLKQDPAGNYIEIEGHTDATGPNELNERLGLARAENVKRYLYETYQIPLHKINVISFGESKPIAPNETRDGRAQNRRVVIKVLA
jgi:outer membrane protein OmpA-like peptidoglycan-associated protein